MFDINDFLGYASNGIVKANSSPKKTSRPRTIAAPSSSVKAVPPAPTMLSTVFCQPCPPVAQSTKPMLEMVDYSEKSFAIFGDTRPMHSTLKGLHGKYNPWLKRNGSVTPGYIFSIKHKETVKKALNL